MCGVHRNCHISLCKCGCVVRAVARHCHKVSFALKIAYHLKLAFGSCFGKKIIHARFCRNGGGGHRVIACNHNGFYAHFTKIRKLFLNALLDNVFQMNNA